MNMKDKLRLCLEQIKGMSQTEFDSIVDKKAIDEVNYDTSRYESSNFNIIFDKDDINTSRNIENYIKSINDFKCANVFSSWKNEMVVLSDDNYDFELVECSLENIYKKETMSLDKQTEENLIITVKYNENKKRFREIEAA